MDASIARCGGRIEPQDNLTDEQGVMKIDTGLMVAAQRCSGSRIHEVANLLQTYTDACFLDDKRLAGTVKQKLYRLMLTDERTEQKRAHGA